MSLACEDTGILGDMIFHGNIWIYRRELSNLSLNDRKKKTPMIMIWKLQICKLEESLDRCIHTIDRCQALVHERHIWLLAIAQELECPRGDRKWRLQLMSRIMDEIHHRIEIFFYRLERLSHIEAHEEEEWYHDHDIHQKKLNQITKNPIKCIIFWRYEKNQISVTCLRFPHEKALLIDDRIL